MDTVETSGTRDATMGLEKEKETAGHEGRAQSKMFRTREPEPCVRGYDYGQGERAGGNSCEENTCQFQEGNCERNIERGHSNFYIESQLWENI